MALIIATEVISTSFTNRATDVNLIKAAYITRAELDFIRPRLGDDLYNLIAADPSALTAKNLILYSTYIKPAMAFYVKYLVLPDLHMNTTSSGIQINNREFSTSAVSKERAELANATLSMATSFLDSAIRYIEHLDNIDYFSTYRTSDETKSFTTIRGGIIFE